MHVNGMTIRRFASPATAARALARHVARCLAINPKMVLGLPTGRTPVPFYAELVALFEAGRVDFGRATTFNLDEFAGLPPEDPGSYRTFMQRHLFSHVNVAAGRINFLNGAARDMAAECRRYEQRISRAGGLDLLLLGLGANGHIGFNEPADELVARTHRVALHDVTRRENAALFGGEAGGVPREALSMGMGTILKAAAIVMIATGERKASCVRAMVRGPLTTRLPASFLQTHRHAEVFLDRDAASLLS